MQALIGLLQNIGVFLAFLAARFAVLVVILAALTVVFLVGLGVARLAGRVRRHAMGLTKVGGLVWRPGLYYAPGHAWLQWKGTSRLRVGLDDLAQHLLAKVSAVTLPSIGQVLRAGEPVATMRAGHRLALIPAPVSGTVVAINRRLLRNPSLIHNDPYARGWLYAVAPSDGGHARLPYGEPSRQWFSGLARAAAIVLFAYFFLKLHGFVDSGRFDLLNTPYGYWFLFEMLGFILAPSLLFGVAVRRGSARLARGVAGWTVLGIVVNRLNLSVITFNWNAAERYVPSFMEVLISATIITIGVMTFRWIVNRMPVLRDDPAYPQAH